MKTCDEAHDIEGRLAGLRVRPPSPGLRDRVLARARAEWAKTGPEPAAPWQELVPRLAAGLAAALVVAALSARVNDVMIARAAAPARGEQQVVEGEPAAHGLQDAYARIIEQARRSALARSRLRERLTWLPQLTGTAPPSASPLHPDRPPAPRGSLISEPPWRMACRTPAGRRFDRQIEGPTTSLS
ncbi:MAG: hypothetical protein JXR77_06585 [Lentisphaeria bacterium]|nr:hypothetical protein [Lentisphaeria bacterium]